MGVDVNQPSTDPVRVLHITDPHLFADSRASLRGTVSCQSLQNVLRHVAASGWQADVVAATGDLIQDDSRRAYERFHELLSPLGLPVYCVPGNHDVRPLMQDVLGCEPFSYCAAKQHGNWLIAGVDSCLEGTAAGRIAEQELERLSAVLRQTTAEHVMVCLHHPPLPVGSKWLDEIGLKNGQRFLRDILAAKKVRLAIFGHVHQQFEGSYESVRVVGTPSTCTQFKPASETFAVDDKPPAYRRITLHRDGGIDSELVWLDGDTRQGGN